MRRFLTSFRVKRAMRAPFLVALLVSLGLVTTIIFSPHIVHAAQTDFGIAQVDQQIGLSGDSIVVIILRVIRILLGFLGLVLVVMILYAGYTIMTSAGNEEKVEQGKKIIKNAVIGTAIIFFSFAIVQFAINVLGGATGLFGGQGQQDQPPGRQSFVGVGSLGDVIKDHYPEPNQSGVYRNTKILITFTDSIDPKTLVNDVNGDGIFGDCTDDGTTKVCDTLKTSVISIIKLDDKGGVQEGDVVEATVQAAYDADGNAHTFVMKPVDLLGSEEGDQWHRVRVSNDVLNIDGDSIFNARPEDSYIWEFETNTEVDLSPPYVVDVSPNPEEEVEKNRVLKITFNEPVNPMMVQGELSPDSAFNNIIVSMMPGEQVVAPAAGPTQTDITFAESTIDQYVGGSVSMVSDGEYLFAAGNGSIKKINIADTSNVQTFFTSQSEIHTILMAQGGLYVLVGRDVVIFNPDTLEQVALFQNVLSRPTAVAFRTGYLYVADDGIINIFDIDPSSGGYGQLAFSYSTQSSRVDDIKIVNNTLYVIKRMVSGDVFEILDNPDPLIPPTLLGQTALGIWNATFTVHQNVAYIVGGGSILRIIDVSDPTGTLSIAQVALNSDETLPVAGVANEILIADGKLFIGQYQGTVKVFTIETDPVQPEYVFSYPGTTEKLNVSNTDNFSFAYHTGRFFVKYKSTPIIVLDFEAPLREDSTGGQRIRTSVDGTWRITNGYRTVEFVSNEACGINSCGEPIYCLPTLCDLDDKNCSVTYAVLARTASLDDPEGDSFASAGLFDGVEDIAGNAMDSKPEYVGARGSVAPGAHDFVIEEGTDWRHKPPMVAEKTVETAERSSDNYWWFFTVKNEIDNEIPYIEKVSPGIDQPGVGLYDPVQVYFSKEMMSLDDIGLVEYPDSGVGLGYQTRFQDVEDGGVTKTLLNLFHPSRPFSLDGKDAWYFPTVPGTVKAVNQFCMYPGRGPDATVPQNGISSPACYVKYNDVGQVLEVSDCMPNAIQTTSSTDTGCVSVNTGVDKAQADTETCLEFFQNDTVSPTQF